jgi:LysM repeat protein
MFKSKQSWCLLVIAGLLSGCTISYSNPPTGSPKADGTSGFSSTSPAIATMNALRTAFIQQTVQAQEKTPGAAAGTSSFSTVAVTPTAGGQDTPIANPTVATQAATPGSAATSTPGLPGAYTIHEGETLYCLARRFDIDPVDLLAANNDDPDVYPDDVVAIPQDGAPFPGERALHPHTPNMSFTVPADYDTVYKVGCYFGDVDPNRIVAANGLKEPFTLIPGQKIIIP